MATDVKSMTMGFGILNGYCRNNETCLNANVRPQFGSLELNQQITTANKLHLKYILAAKKELPSIESGLKKRITEQIAAWL